MSLALYDYFRSTAAYRVRIALHLKGIPFEKLEVHLVNQGGEQHLPTYKAVNPQGLVPTLSCPDENFTLSQSLAILDYLEDSYPTPSLFPGHKKDKAIVKSMAYTICCDIHPLNNLRVLQYLKQTHDLTEQQITNWYHHWLKLGFDSLEIKLNLLQRTKPVCFGDEVSLADICLIPQLYNAKRFKFPLDAYPLLCEIDEYCLGLECFQLAQPNC